MIDESVPVVCLALGCNDLAASECFPKIDCNNMSSHTSRDESSHVTYLIQISRIVSIPPL
jgi:hypothetical protein